MSRVVVFMKLTLDGVMQAPGRQDEDRRGGFAHGGWAVPYPDASLGGLVGDGAGDSVALLLGRRTYEDFYAVWPGRTDNPFSELLNSMQKYVSSTTLEEPLPWGNSTLLKGNAARTVARLKERSRQDQVVLGSGELVQALMHSAARRRVRAPDPSADPGVWAASLS
jgi:dihydrofolate reductase